MQTRGQRIIAIAIFFMLFLDVFATPSSPRPARLPEKSSGDSSNKDDALFAEATEQWANKRTCHKNYFQRTPGGFKDLGLEQFYNDTISKLITNFPDQYEQLGEISLFGLYAAGIQNFNCTSQTGMCQHLPDCPLVAGYIADSHPDEPAYVVERTRKILWIIEHMNDVNKYYNKAETLNLNVQTTTMGEVGTTVNRYTTQPDLKAEKECVSAKRVYEFLIQLGKELNSQAWNIGTGGIFNSVSAAGMNIPSPAPMINLLFIELPRMLTEVNTKSKEMDKQDAYTNAKMSSDGQLKMTQSYLQGLCAEFGGGMEDEQYIRSTQMHYYLSKLFTKLNEVHRHFWNMIMHGNPSEGQRALFASTLDSSDVNAAFARLANNQDSYTKQMVKGIREILISESMTSSHCYVKCSDKSKKAESFCATSGKEQESRYCPNADIGCRIQCFTTREKGNTEVELVGIKHLVQDHLTVNDIMRHSFDNYERHGNFYLLSENLNKTGMGFDMIDKGDVSMISLPVCVSKHIDYTKSGGFPAMCGDWTGNETELFHSRIGFGKDDRDVTSNMAEELKTKIVPAVLKPLPPLTNYLNLCRNGVQFPDTSNSGIEGSEELILMHRYALRGPSEHCDAMFAETKGMREGEANHYFCTLSLTAKKIFAVERGWVDNNGNPFEKNHATKCEQFLKDYHVSASKDMPW